jgi:IS605 OrfB family transposase
MKLVKTIKARIFNPTQRKMDALNHLWISWKKALEYKRDYSTLRLCTDLPSFYCRELSWKIKAGVDAPVGVPKDALILLPGAKYVPWFASIPTSNGRIYLPLRMSREHSLLLKECDICDSRLIRRKARYYLHIVVSKSVKYPIIPSHAPVLAVDLGERVIATSVTLIDGTISSPRFHGKDVRSIRRHYAWLRKRLGRRKKFDVIKRIGSTEHRRVDARLHEISSVIISQALELGAVIALGDLTGIRKSSRGRRMNRIINAMPFNRLTTLIEYKAAWAGIPVIKVDEAYSSHECRVCKQDGIRPSQGRFICPSCGEFNADLNGAVNIGSRALAYMAIAGASGTTPMRGFRAPKLGLAVGQSGHVPQPPRNPRRSNPSF